MKEIKTKIRVSDKPIINTQKFLVCVSGEGSYTVTRKKIIRQQHNMICTDDMEEGEVDIRIEYEVIKTVSPEECQMAIDAVKEKIKSDKENINPIMKAKLREAYDNNCFGDVLDVVKRWNQ